MQKNLIQKLLLDHLQYRQSEMELDRKDDRQLVRYSFDKVYSALKGTNLLVAIYVSISVIF